MDSSDSDMSDSSSEKMWDGTLSCDCGNECDMEDEESSDDSDSDSDMHSSTSSTSDYEPEELTWTIAQFRKLNNCIVSRPSISVGSNRSIRFRLHLTPKAVMPSSGNNKPQVAIFIAPANPNQYTRDVWYTIFLVDSEGNKWRSQYGLATFSQSQHIICYFPRNEILKPESKLLRNDVLTLECKVEVLDLNCTHSSQHMSRNKVQQDKESFTNVLIKDIKFLLITGIHHDVVISCGKHYFPAHKAILAARSPVFAAHFAKEAEAAFPGEIIGEYEVEDFTPSIIEQMLRYIYTGEVKDVEEQAPELLAIANKFKLEELKKVCLDHLAPHINTGWVCRILMIAHVYRFEQLRLKCIEYIGDNVDEVKATKGWQLLIKSPEWSEISVDLCLHLASKNSSNK